MSGDGIDTRSEGKTALIIAGMHRSGTSALARVVSLLGYDLPKTLIGAAPSNETGHWESVLVQRFNDDLLRSVSSFWFDWREVEPEWFGSPAADELRERCRGVLEAEYGGSSAIVLKDPRICRILPFWLELLEGEGFRPVVIIPLRNPVEVAASLKKRNGFEVQAGHLMWLRHVLDAEAASRGVPRYFTDYDRLLGDWRGMVGEAQARLGIDWPQDPEAVSDRIGAFLSDKYRHHRETDDDVFRDPALSLWLRDTYRILSGWVANGEDGKDYAALDLIREDLNAARGAFGWLVEGQAKQTLRVQRLENLLAERQAELESARNDLETKSGEIRRMSDDTLQRRETLEMPASLAAEIAEMTASLQQASQGRDEAQGPGLASERLSRVREDLADLVRSLPEAERLATSVAKHIADLLANVDGEPEALSDQRWGGPGAVDAESVRLELEGQLRAAREETDKLLVEKQLVEESLQRRFDEIAVLTRAVIDRETRMEEAARRIRDAVAGLREKAKPSLLERLSGVRYRMWRLRKSGLFDEEWYLSQYRDVAEAGVDPLFHYVRYGAEEGRHPNPLVAPLPKIKEL